MNSGEPLFVAGVLARTEAGPERAPSSFNSIQILRVIAAFVVVVWHAHTELVSHQGGQDINRVLFVGNSGVHIFFVISGFVMVYTATRGGLGAGGFLLRRLLRIYPTYWLLAAAYLLCYPMLGLAHQVTASELFAALSLWPTASMLVIKPGWTLSYEMYFYLCFALSLLLGHWRGLIALTSFFLLSILARGLFDGGGFLTNMVTSGLLLEFLAGCWLAQLLLSGWRLSDAAGTALLVAGAAGFVASIFYDTNFTVISFGIPSLLLVAGAVTLEKRMCGPVARALARLGDSSYFLYLSHVLVLKSLLATPLVQLDREQYHTVLLALPLAIVCTGFAAVGYRLVELPLLRTLKFAINRSERSATSPARTLPAEPLPNPSEPQRWTPATRLGAD